MAGIGRQQPLAEVKGVIEWFFGNLAVLGAVSLAAVAVIGFISYAISLSAYGKREF